MNPTKARSQTRSPFTLRWHHFFFRIIAFYVFTDTSCSPLEANLICIDLFCQILFYFNNKMTNNFQVLNIAELQTEKVKMDGLSPVYSYPFKKERFRLLSP
jgi:hypothetical protein